MRIKLVFSLIIIFLLASCRESPTSPQVPPAATLSPQAQQGKQLFTQECASCHSLTTDTVLVGPSLAGIVDRAEQQFPEQEARIYILTSILRPCDYLVAGYDCLMPQNLGKKLTGEEIDAIVAYLMAVE